MSSSVRLIVCATALALGTAATTSCTSGTSGARSSPSTRASETTSDTGSQSVATGDSSCPDVTGKPFAEVGPLQAGPFEESVLQIPATWHQAKVWVSSSRVGRDDATVEVAGPDGHTATSIRKGGEASVDSAAQFWPGGIEIPRSGAYRIDIRVGTDHLCATVRYVLT